MDCFQASCPLAAAEERELLKECELLKEREVPESANCRRAPRAQEREVPKSARCMRALGRACTSHLVPP